MDFVQDKHLIDLVDYGEIVEIIPGNLWCIDSVYNGWNELHFVTFRSSDINESGESITVDSFFKIEGPSEGLREGRHTRFPDKGYVFYMNKKYMEAALNYCTKYFDMD